MTRLQKILVPINFLGAVISFFLLAATFFGQQAIIRGARQYAVAKTERFLEPTLQKAENLLNGRLVKMALPPEAQKRLELEVSRYRESPEIWLLGMMDATGARARDFEFPEVKNPLARSTLDLVVKGLTSARKHFDTSYSNLILDLRIFATTNGCAFLIAGWLCFIAKSKRMQYILTVWSVSLCISTFLGSYFYSGQSWIWNILANSYLGWSYLIIHLTVSIYLISHLMPSSHTRIPNDAN